jgi:hypothetical protein
MLRSLLCWMMIALIPASLLGADTGAAMLYGKGVILLNGATLPNSSAIYPDDVIETKADSVANINVTGSTVMIGPESIVKFEDNAVELEHGSVSVSTAYELRVYVKCIKVIPAASVQTQFDVINTNGKVHAVARKSDVNIDTGGKVKNASKTTTTSSQNATLREGQDTTRDENSCAAALDRGAYPTATGGLLSSPYALYAGEAIVGGVLIWVLLQDGPPTSPSSP